MAAARDTLSLLAAVTLAVAGSPLLASADQCRIPVTSFPGYVLCPAECGFCTTARNTLSCASDCHFFVEDANCVGEGYANTGTSSNGCVVFFDRRLCARTLTYSTGQCLTCEPGRFGPMCSSVCPGGTASPCGNDGTCDEGVSGSGVCTCAAGHAGDACQYSDALTCNDHGAAQEDGSCICVAAFAGATCNRCDVNLLGYPACETICGDVDNDRDVDQRDVATFRLSLADPLGARLSPIGTTLCSVVSPLGLPLCDMLDLVVIARSVESPSLLPRRSPVCTVLFDQVIGTQLFDIRRAPSRLLESAMGNMVADAILSRYPGVEAAFSNSGGMRADLACEPPSADELPCEITWLEMFSVLPFGNRTVIATLTGVQLEQAFVNGFSPACNPAISTGRFPQVSGVRVTFFCDGVTPVVTGMWKTPQGIGGPETLIGPGDSVRIVTNNFLFAGGDGYAVFSEGTNVAELGDYVLDLVTGYITTFSPVGPVVQGRIDGLVP